MNWKKLIFVGMLFAIFLGMIHVSNASDVENHGMIYDTIYGPAHLKTGSLESEVFTTFDDPYKAEPVSCEVTLENGESWMIDCKVREGFEHEIIGATKIVDGKVIKKIDVDNIVIEDDDIDTSEVESKTVIVKLDNGTDDVPEGAMKLSNGELYWPAPYETHIIKPIIELIDFFQELFS